MQARLIGGETRIETRRIPYRLVRADARRKGLTQCGEAALCSCAHSVAARSPHTAVNIACVAAGWLAKL